MLRTSILVLAIALPTLALAQTWYPLEGEGPYGQRTQLDANGNPPSPNLGDPTLVERRHFYDPAYPTRNLPVEGGGVPVVELTPRSQGVLIDRAPLDQAHNPPPMIPIGEEHLWISGMPHVVDGDSLGIDGRLLRLAGIDAPEVDQLCYVGNLPQRCGVESRAWLAAQIEDTRLDCRIHYPDGAQRLVSTCWRNGQEINGLAIREGMAVVWAGAPSPYEGMQHDAQARGVGVWATDFRHPAEWRSIMDGARNDEDAAIADGERPSTLPFPYRPFTDRAGMGRPSPVYELGR
jgi:endonuclease YncB( thermonuclease family)